MDDRSTEAHHAINEARNALRRGDRNTARKLAEHAASLTPQAEDPWLILAAVASPQTSINYIKKALELNPDSARARNAMAWAMKRLQESTSGQVTVQSPARSVQITKRRGPLYAALLFALGCVVLLVAAWSASTSPVLASLLKMTSQQPVSVVHPQSWARAEIAKPTYTPASPPLNLADIQITPTSVDLQPVLDIPTQEPPALEPQPLVEVLPADGPSPDIVQPSVDNLQTQPSTGTILAEIVPDTPTPSNAAPTSSPDQPLPQVASYSGEHWIDVDLSQQRVYAYAGDTVVNSFVVSTGTWQTPTVTGEFKIWIKLRYTDMSGPGYYLPDVPYTMYFYKGYGLHGTYWHNNFGTPMSHGCVNLSIPDAEWLYNFSSVGTVVNVHY